MPRPRHPRAALALLVVLCFALSSCVHLQRDVALNNDGTGTYSFSLGFSDKLIAVAGSSFGLQMKTCGALVQTSGGAYSMADTGGYSTWTFTWHFNSLSRLNSLLAANAEFCSISNTNIPTTATANDSFDVTAHGHFLTTTYVLSGHLSFVLQSTDTTQDPNTTALLQEAYSSFAISMPGWISSATPGGSQNGSTVKYTAHNGDTLDFQVVGEGVNISALLLIGGGVLLLVGLLVLILMLIRRAERRDDERHAAEVALAPVESAE